MTTKRPRTTISFDLNEYEELQEWADSEYRTIPQLVLVFVKKALEERRESTKSEVTPAEPQPAPTKNPPASKTKRGRESDKS